MNVVAERSAPSLVDLCIKTAIDKVRYLGDVGGTDDRFLEQTLPHCTLAQLTHVENCTKGRDLSPVTNKLWKRFYRIEFGDDSVDVLKEIMKLEVIHMERRVSGGYSIETGLVLLQKKHNSSIGKLKELYKKEDASNGSAISNVKSNITKKAISAYIKSPEAINVAVMKKTSFIRSHGNSAITKPSIAPRRSSKKLEDGCLRTYSKQ